MDKLTRTGQDFENEFCSGCDCVYYGEPNGCNHPDGNCGSYTYFTLVADRLAEYEDTGLSPAEVAELVQAKADGRLVVLPVSVGDTVYCIHNSCIELCKVEAVHFALRSYIRLKPFKQPYLVYHSICYTPLLSSFGKIVFLTREEAEKALKECESK